jgi:hypothetical protein
MDAIIGEMREAGSGSRVEEEDERVVDDAREADGARRAAGAVAREAGARFAARLECHVRDFPSLISSIVRPVATDVS